MPSVPLLNGREKLLGFQEIVAASVKQCHDVLPVTAGQKNALLTIDLFIRYHAVLSPLERASRARGVPYTLPLELDAFRASGSRPY